MLLYSTSLNLVVDLEGRALLPSSLPPWVRLDPPFLPSPGPRDRRSRSNIIVDRRCPKCPLSSLFYLHRILLRHSTFLTHLLSSSSDTGTIIVYKQAVCMHVWQWNSIRRSTSNPPSKLLPSSSDIRTMNLQTSSVYACLTNSVWRSPSNPKCHVTASKTTIECESTSTFFLLLKLCHLNVTMSHA